MKKMILISLVLGAVGIAQAQIRFRVAAGLSTDWITNDNPATYRFVTAENAADTMLPYGGALDGVQVGWGIRGYVDLDKQKYFRIPIGLDVFSFSGTQSSSDGLSGIQVRHEVTLVSSMVGFEWSFVEFPLAFARAYIGGEIRPLFVQPNNITSRNWNSQTSPRYDSTWTYNGKESATRLGAMARIGVEGELYYPVFINTSVAYGVMNLIGRDQRSVSEGGRGELLTAVKLGEGSETFVHHLNFTFMIQVRL